MSLSSSPKTLSVGRLLFGAAAAVTFAQFGAVSSLNDVAHHFGTFVAGASLKDRVGLSGSALGVGLAVLRLASLAALPLNSWADRSGRVRVVRVLASAGLLVTALASLSPSYWFFVACFAVARPLLSAVGTLVQVLTVELHPPARRLHYLALLAAGAGFGAGLSSVLHGLIRGPNSFRWLFLLALVPLLLLVPRLKRIPEPLTHDPSAPLARLGSVPRALRGKVAILAVAAFVVGAITGPANGFAFVYGEGVLNLRPRFVALVVLLSALTGLAGLALSRSLGARWGRRLTAGLGAVATAVTSTFAYSGGRWAFTFGYLVGVMAAGLHAPAMSALATESFAPHRRATAMGWIAVSGVLGATAGLFFFGWVIDVSHVSGVNALRGPALATFLPLLPLLALLARLPEPLRHEGEIGH